LRTNSASAGLLAALRVAGRRQCLLHGSAARHVGQPEALSRGVAGTSAGQQTEVGRDDPALAALADRVLDLVVHVGVARGRCQDRQRSLEFAYGFGIAAGAR
jgi:hypothetical protein